MWHQTLEKTAELIGGIYSMGCDPGPTHCAFVLAHVPFMKIPEPVASVMGAWYVPNNEIGPALLTHTDLGRLAHLAHIFAYESCGSQGSVPGETTFETAAMGGEVRAMMRPRVNATYMFSPDRWRYMLCGRGNANDRAIAEGLRALFPATGGGADPYTGTKAKPGPLWALRVAGAGGNAVHLRDALGVALAPMLIRFRCGMDPEAFRRAY